MVKQLEILKALADKTRLDIVGILMREDSYTEKIAEELEITPATVSYHLKKMEGVGIVNCSRSQFYIIYSLNREIFDLTLSEFVAQKEEDEEEKYKKKVLSAFFEYGRLVSLPVQRKKREIVLKEIGKSFEKNRIYNEQEINEIIHKFNEDHCTIRREMVAYQILERNDGKYKLRT